MIHVYPTIFEAVTDDYSQAFKVSMFDAHCATIEIKTPVNTAIWDEIAPAIRQCLVDMKLGDAEKG